MKFSGRFKSRLEANVGIGGCVSSGLRDWRASATRAKHSRHHTKDKQRSILSWLRMIPSLGTNASTTPPEPGWITTATQACAPPLIGITFLGSSQWSIRSAQCCINFVREPISASGPCFL